MTGSLSRRRFLGSAVLTAGSVLLSSCGRSSPRRAPGLLPLHPDTPRVDPGSRIERGARLRIFQWRDYLSADVLDGFARRHAVDDVRVEVESFTTMAEAVSRLRAPDGDFDVFFPTVDALAALANGRLLRPLTPELLPHRSNLWPFFLDAAGPFYDVGQRYSVPYTVYSTGIGWRRDLVRAGDAPDRLENPYDAFWNARHRGAVGIYDDYREAIAMSLLRRGVDPNTPDERRIDAAVDDLIAMAQRVTVEVSASGAYDELQTGEYAVQQAWSGDLLSAKRFGTVAADDAGEVGFVWPRGGVVGCDLTAICARGRNPVAAHAFVDHLLDVGVAMANFRWNGYQPPVGDEPPAVDPYLRDAILAPEDLVAGRFLRRLSAAADARWRVGWQRFLDALPG